MSNKKTIARLEARRAEILEAYNKSFSKTKQKQNGNHLSCLWGFMKDLKAINAELDAIKYKEAIARKNPSIANFIRGLF